MEFFSTINVKNVDIDLILSVYMSNKTGEEKGMKNKIYVIIVTLLICLSGIVIIPNNLEVEASGGGGGEDNETLDTDYIWDMVNDIAKVVYRYPDGLIPKGRAFGSWGANRTVFNILKYEMNNNLSLGDVHEEQLGHIDGNSWEYTTCFWINDFQLTVNNNDYETETGLPSNIPKKESFLMAAGCSKSKLTYFDGNPTFNNTFSNVKITPKNMTSFNILGGTFNNFYYQIPGTSNVNNKNSIILGNLTYITENETISYSEQFDRVFLINESSGNCQEQLDNITNASATFVIDSGPKGLDSIDTSSCVYPVIAIPKNNGTDLLSIIQNYTYILVDNVTGNLTFTYNFSNMGSYPNQNFTIIDRIPDHYELEKGDFPNDFIKFVRAIQGKNLAPPYNFGDYVECWGIKAMAWHIINQFLENLSKPVCKAFILYSSFEHHWMLHTKVNFKNIEYNTSFCIENLLDLQEVIMDIETPRLQTFTINYTVGDWLVDNYADTTLTGYGNQSLLEETDNTSAVDAYNVIGNITIDQSPNDAIAILSNRIDGWWGQTPGDSGIGGAIVLGIAKYFKDYNIKPKYNLTFLFTTGEEIGCRGAWHYNNTHPDDNVIYYFGLDQLGMNQSDQVLELFCKDLIHWDILNETLNQTQYYQRTGYVNKTDNSNGSGSEMATFSSRENCSSFMFVKGAIATWDHWHRTGLNYSEGDCLARTDRDDVNVTAELYWNLTKYFLVNPDIWFDTYSITPFDSPNDTGDKNDGRPWEQKRAEAQNKSYPKGSLLYACAGLGDNEAIIKVNEIEKYFTLNIGNNDIEPNKTGWIEKIEKLGIRADEAETDESLQKIARDCTCGIVFFDDKDKRRNLEELLL